MIKPTGETMKAGDVAATAQRVDEVSALLLGRLADMLRRAGSIQAADILAELENDTRARLKQFIATPDAQAAAAETDQPPLPLCPPDQAWNLALDLGLHRAALFEVLEAMGDDESARDEAQRLAGQAKSMMVEWDRRRSADQK